MNYAKNITHTFNTQGNRFDLSTPMVFYYTGDCGNMSSEEYQSFNHYASAKQYMIDIVNYINESEGYGAQDVLFYYIPSPTYSTNHYGYFFFNQFIDYTYLQVDSQSVNAIAQFACVDFVDYTNNNDFDSAFYQSVPNSLYNYAPFDNSTSVLANYQAYNNYISAKGDYTLFDLTQVYGYDTPASGNLFEFQLYRENLMRTSALRVHTTSSNLYDLTLNYYVSNGEGEAYHDRIIGAREEGRQEGFRQGLIAGREQSEFSDAFDFVGSSFTALESVLAIQFFPGITLGLVVSIPLLFGIFAMIFKLIKK